MWVLLYNLVWKCAWARIRRSSRSLLPYCEESHKHGAWDLLITNTGTGPLHPGQLCLCTSNICILCVCFSLTFVSWYMYIYITYFYFRNLYWHNVFALDVGFLLLFSKCKGAMKPHVGGGGHSPLPSPPPSTCCPAAIGRNPELARRAVGLEGEESFKTSQGVISFLF